MTNIIWYKNILQNIIQGLKVRGGASPLSAVSFSPIISIYIQLSKNQLLNFILNKI